MSLIFFPQEMRYSCTAACLRMVLAHWSIVLDEAAVRICCRTTTQGTLASDAVACARSYGLQADELRRTTWANVDALLIQAVYPIALINLLPLKTLWVKHAVVIEAVSTHWVTYLDPIYGRQTSETAAFDQAWMMNQHRAIVVSR